MASHGVAQQWGGGPGLAWPGPGCTGADHVKRTPRGRGGPARGPAGAAPWRQRGPAGSWRAAGDHVKSGCLRGRHWWPPAEPLAPIGWWGRAAAAATTAAPRHNKTARPRRSPRAPGAPVPFPPDRALRGLRPQPAACESQSVCLVRADPHKAGPGRRFAIRAAALRQPARDPQLVPPRTHSAVQCSAPHTARPAAHPVFSASSGFSVCMCQSRDLYQCVSSVRPPGPIGLACMEPQPLSPPCTPPPSQLEQPPTMALPLVLPASRSLVTVSESRYLC